MGLMLYQVLTDTNVKKINETNEDVLSPIFIDIPTLEGAEYINKFEIINETDNILYRNINISIDDTNDQLDQNITVKLIVKSTEPTIDEINNLINKNSIVIDELKPGEFVTLWIYVKYPGANELNLLYSLEKVYNIELVIDSEEVYI